MNEVIGLLEKHRSIRSFLDQPVERVLLERLINSGQHASSSSLLQAYSIIGVNDPEKRAKLAAWCGDQEHIQKAPVFLVFCGDMYRLQQACEQEGVAMVQGMTEQLLLAAVDAAIAAQNIMIAAESMGLGGVYVGAIRNEPQKVTEMLQLPAYVFPVFGMSLGYPAQDPGLKPRLPLPMVYMEEHYTYDGDLLKEYDAAFEAYLKERKSNTRDQTWSATVSQKLNKELRPHMKAYLQGQGYSMK